MSLHPRRRRRFSFGAMIWLTLVWVLLWGDLSIGNVLSGLVVGVVVGRLFPLPPVDMRGWIHPWGTLVLVSRFAYDLVHASIQVSAIALRRDAHPRGAVIRAQLRSHSDLYLTLTAELCSLVPGSIVVEAHRLTGTLYLHVLDVEKAGGIEAARRSVLAQEERVLRALASDEELAEAGLSPRRGLLGRRGAAEGSRRATEVAR